MKELFRERDATRVGFYQSVLEAEGIPTMIKNQDLTMSGLAEFPIPEFFPALCVIHDEDAERALQILKQRMEESQKDSEDETSCPNCKEMNPGNFDICWACEGLMRAE